MDKVLSSMLSSYLVSDIYSEEDPLDRELQSTELARMMAASYPKPVIFLGYVVTNPHALRRKSTRLRQDA
jgi:hypothetical protein